MVEIYKLPHQDLKWSVRKLLQGEPFVVVEYLYNNAIQYEVSVFQLKDEDESVLSNEISTDTII